MHALDTTSKKAEGTIGVCSRRIGNEKKGFHLRLDATGHT